MLQLGEEMPLPGFRGGARGDRMTKAEAATTTSIAVAWLKEWAGSACERWSIDQLEALERW